MSSPSKFSCPSCSMLLKMAGVAPGQRVKCPKCATVFAVPAAAPPPPEAPAKKTSDTAQRAPRPAEQKPSAAPAARNPAPTASSTPAPPIKKNQPTLHGTPPAAEQKPAAAKAPGTLPEVRLPAEGQKPGATPGKRKAAQTFAGNTTAANEAPPLEEVKPTPPGRLECPVCGGMVKPPAGSGPGKPMKCPLCTASFPVPAGYKAESAKPAPAPTADTEPDEEKPAAPSRFECPVCGGLVKPPAGSGPGKPMKCPLCTASFPVPAGYRAEPAKPAPAASQPAATLAPTEPAESFTSDLEVPNQFSTNAIAVQPSSPPAEMGFSPAPESAPSERETPENGKVKTSAQPSSLLAWVVFAISASVFVALLVLWRMAEAGKFDH
jgi:DNA-directed RNA polymerase subunit M/transcription elongation factor TFIIS